MNCIITHFSVRYVAHSNIACLIVSSSPLSHIWYSLLCHSDHILFFVLKTFHHTIFHTLFFHCTIQASSFVPCHPFISVLSTSPLCHLHFDTFFVPFMYSAFLSTILHFCSTDLPPTQSYNHTMFKQFPFYLYK